MIPNVVKPAANSPSSALRFLRSFSRIKSNKHFENPDEEIRRRSQRIKVAAYSSMARSVGSRRVWSKALLLKLRKRASRRGFGNPKCVLSQNKLRAVKTRPSREPSQANRLRKLVPGGETMDICNLLEETAHYIKCLSAQVKLMQSIADRFSN